MLCRACIGDGGPLSVSILKSRRRERGQDGFFTVKAQLGQGMLVGVMRLDSWAAFSMAPGAWSVRYAYWRSFGLIGRLLCFVVFLGGARPLLLADARLGLA